MRGKMSNSNTEVFVALITLFGWIALGTFVFYRLEDWTRIQAFYFAVVSITTVGYGDFVPTSDLSRLFAAIYILIGVSIGIVTLGLLGSKILEYRLRRFNKDRSENE